MTCRAADSEGRVVSGATGTAARFFPQFGYEAADFWPFKYVAKAGRAERERGLEGLPRMPQGHNLSTNACAHCGKRIKHNGSGEGCECGELRETVKLPSASRNNHPTVKSVQLMRWLLTLVTPPGGLVLDPFAGSGSTLVAAKMLGVRCVGIEQDAGYADIARQRIAAVQPGMVLDA